MMESALIFLTSLITLRTNLGLSEQVQPYSGTSLEVCGAISALVSVVFRFQLFADPDPGSQTNADPDPDQTLTKSWILT